MVGTPFGKSDSLYQIKREREDPKRTWKETTEKNMVYLNITKNMFYDDDSKI